MVNYDSEIKFCKVLLLFNITLLVCALQYLLCTDQSKFDEHNKGSDLYEQIPRKTKHTLEE